MGTWKKIIALVLLISMVAGLMPAAVFGTVARAETPDPTVVEAREFSDLPAQAAELAAQGQTRSEGNWQYVAIPDTDYAAVVGYADTSATTLEMPDMLGGLDVVAVAPGALADVSFLEKITVPGNVRAIGDAAFARGTSIKAVNAAYALGWATENKYPSVNASEFQFREGVVDLSDIRTDNFVRISATEVWLRALEASRLQKGSFFFLADPNNLYQISFYKVTAVTDMQNGFFRFTCETPQVESIFYYYEASNAALVPDAGSIALYDGATLVDENGNEVDASSYGYKEEKSSLQLNLNYKFDLGSFGEVKLNGLITKKYTGSFKAGAFVEKETTITEKDIMSVSVR